MISITINGKDYVVGAFSTLYRVEVRDIGRVQVPVRANSAEGKRVHAANQLLPPQAP